MKTFNYASTSAVKENLTYLILGAALIVFPLVHPFGIRIGAKPVLGPLPTTILLIIAGLYMLYTAYRKIRQARALSAKGGVITVDDDRVTYPVIRKGQVETEAFSISEISNISYDEEDGILTVTLGGGREPNSISTSSTASTGSRSSPHCCRSNNRRHRPGPATRWVPDDRSCRSGCLLLFLR